MAENKDKKKTVERIAGGAAIGAASLASGGVGPAIFGAVAGAAAGSIADDHERQRQQSGEEGED